MGALDFGWLTPFTLDLRCRAKVVHLLLEAGACVNLSSNEEFQVTGLYLAFMSGDMSVGLLDATGENLSTTILATTL